MNLPDNAAGPMFVAELRREFADCQRRIRHCIDQLDDNQLWHRTGDDFNSIANLLLHLSGNISQRILSLVGGQPDRRDRAAEFAARGPIAKAVLAEQLDRVFRQTDLLLADLPGERLFETRRWAMLQGEVEGTVLRLLLQTLTHLAGHTQEIIAQTRLLLHERYRFMLPPASKPRPT